MMKTILFLAVLLALPALASAQSVNATASVITSAPSTARDINGFQAKNYPGMTREQARRPANPNVVLRPRTGGVFTDGATYGPEIVSPVAPASWGVGEKYLSAPSPSEDVKRVSGPAGRRTSGGFKLFSLEF